MVHGSWILGGFGGLTPFNEAVEDIIKDVITAGKKATPDAAVVPRPSDIGWGGTSGSFDRIGSQL